MFPRRRLGSPSGNSKGNLHTFLSPFVLKFMIYVTFDWDSEHETPDLGSKDRVIPDSTFSEDKITRGEHSRTITFELYIKMPSPRYYPMMFKGDKRGRKVTSKFPHVTA